MRPPGEDVRLAVDVGGTFIDLVLVDERTGEIALEKQPSTPERRADEIVTALGRLPVPAADVTSFVHGSTIVLNAVVQELGATVGLLTTRGFRDVLELGRGARPDIYDWLSTPPPPMVPRRRRREVDERLRPDGTVLVSLDPLQVDEEVDRLLAAGVDSVAIVFLHAFVNPIHERMAAERIRVRHPELPIGVSSEIANEWREFERTSTTVLNALTQPMFGAYLDGLQRRLGGVGLRTPVAVMQSSGGIMDAARARNLPVRALSSGPAGGAIAARALAAELGVPDAIGTDVGGTTFDVVLIHDGRLEERSESSFGGRPVVAPTIDIASVGAGCGSIAWIDETGSIRVGPRSAGAIPGPVCFGAGGIEPTVTDCQLVLGRLDAERFLGSRLRLDGSAALASIQRSIAEPLGLSVEAAAEGVVTIAESNMGHAIHAMTVERGIDPRGFVLLAYGGGGGLFASATAEGLEIPTVVIPRAPSVFSAWGLLVSAHREDATRTRVRSLTPGTAVEILDDLEDLRRQVERSFEAFATTTELVTVDLHLDLRFEGQEHTVTIPMEEAWLTSAAGLVQGAGHAFVERHRRLYGHGDPHHAIEVVAARCRGTRPRDRPRWPVWPNDEPGAPRDVRPVRFAGSPLETAVFDRDTLAVDQRIPGPALVDEWSTTIVVGPGWEARVDRLGNLVLERSS